MAQYTSEEALNGILNIISSVVDDYYENRNTQNKQQSNNETADLITNLLGGASASASANKSQSVGDQVEALARGMKIIKETGISSKDGKNVASIISTIGSALNNLDLGSYNNESALSIAMALTTLGKIDARIINSINEFAKIKPGALKTITNIFNTLAIDINKLDSLNNFSKLKPEALKSLTDLFYTLSSNIDNLKSISQFANLKPDALTNLEDLLNALNIDKLNAINNFAKLKQDALRNITDLFNVLNIDKLNTINLFANLKSDALNNITELIDSLSIDKLNSLNNFAKLNKESINNIANLFDVLDVNTLKSINNFSKLAPDALKNIAVLIDTLSTDKLDSINNFAKLKQDALGNITDLFSSLNNDIVKSINSFSKLNLDALKNITELFSTLDIDIDKMRSIKKLEYVFTPEFGLTLTSFAKSFDIKKSDISNINKLVALLSAFKAINDDVIDSINNLDKINIKTADSIINFVEKFNNSVTKSIKKDSIDKSIDSIVKLFSSINDIIAKQQLSLKTLLMPMKGRLIGKAIANFINAILESVPEKEIKIQINGLGNLISTMAQFADPNNPMSIKKLKKIMSYENGQDIGLFFKGLLDKIPVMYNKDKSPASATIVSISSLIEMLAKFTARDFRKIKKMLSYKNGQSIGQFFKAIIEELPESKKDIESVSKIVRALSSLGSTSAIGLMMLKPVLTEKFGKSINAFVTNLTNGMTTDRIKQVDIFTASMKPLGQGILLLTSSILLIGAAIAVLGVKNVLMSMGAVTIFTAGILAIIKKMSASEKDIKSGSSSLKDIAKVITLLTADVVLLTVAANMMDFVDWIALGKIAVAFTMISSVMLITMKISKDYNANGKEIKNTMQGISIILLTASISIGIMTHIAKNNNIMDIGLGLAVIGLVVTGMSFLVNKILDKSNKDYDNAINNMAKLTGLLAAVSLISMFILPNIGKNFGPTLAGGAVVSGIMFLMTKMVTSLAKIDNKKLDEANKTLGLILGSFTAISLISAFILPKIGEHIIDAGLGAVVVMSIISLMSRSVKNLSKIDKGNLTEANWSLLTLTAMFASISLIAGFVLPKIGDNLTAVLTGSLVVMSIIGIMSIIVHKLSKNIKRNDLKQANYTLLTLTAMFASISLVTGLVLPKIGDNIGSVTTGLLAVTAVVTGMATIVTLMTKFIKRKDLKQANETLGTLTLMFASISLIAAFILPAIGDNIGAVSIGLGVVTAVIAVLSGIVILLTKTIGRRQLKQAHKTLAVLTAMLVAVSIISAVLFPAIANSANEVIVGGVIVLGIIGVMVSLVAGLSLIRNSSLRSGILALAAIGVMLVATSYIVRELIIPIGEQWEPAKNGSIVVVAVIAGMGAIVALAGKVLKINEIIKGAVAIGLSAALLAGVSYIINELIIPIGADAKKAAEGSKVVIATIGAFGIIVAAAGKLSIGTIGKGVTAVGAISGLLWAIGKMMPSYIKLALMMEKDAKKIAIGGAEVAATIAAWGIIMEAVGALIFGPQAAVLAAGAGAVTGISAVLFAIGKMMPSYIRTSLLTDKNKQHIKSGSVVLKETIMSWGLIIGAVGALIFGPQAAILALGAGAVTGIAKVIHGIDGVIPKYVSMAKVATNNRGVIKTGSESIKMMLSKITELISSIGKMTLKPMTSIAMLKGKMTIGTIGSVITKLSSVIEPLARILAKVKAYNITPAEIGKLSKLFMADKTKSTGNDIFGAMKNICNSMNEIGILSSAKASIILKNIQPIFNTISTFVDVVGKLSSMKYVSEWNSDGTPKSYETLSMSKFRDAANTISISFRVFMTELSKGMDSLKNVSLGSIAKLSVGIRPIINAVNTFTNTVLSALNAKIETEWDKDGKPTKFRKFTPVEFRQAATVIASGFANFIITFGEAIAPFSQKAGAIFNTLKNGIKPVVDSVIEFTNSVYGIMDGREFTVTENGQDVRKFIKFDAQKFKDTATTVSKSFTDFVNTIYNAFSKYEIDVTEYESYVEKQSTAWGFSNKETTKFKEKTVKKNKVGILLNNLADVGILVAAVGDLTNLVLDIAEKKNFDKVANTASIMSKSFTDFISTMCDKLGSDSIEAKLENTTKNLDNIKKLISSFKNPYNEMSSIFSDKKYSEFSIENTEKLFSVIEYTISQDNLSRIKNVDPKEIESIIPYTSTLNKIAKNLNDLTKAMKNADMTNACTQFIKDIEILTQPQLANKANASRRALNMFGTDLTKFTKVVVHSEKKMVTFTGKMNKAETALKKFDNTLVNNERKRNKALEEFARMVDGMATSIEKLSEKIESLDQNKIIENFQGIKDMLELANNNSTNTNQPADNINTSWFGVVPKTSITKSPNQTSKTAQTQRNAGSNSVIYQPVPKRKSQRITMQFANTHFDGFITTEDI